MESEERFIIFPDCVGVNPEGNMSIAGHDLAMLAQKYGTPLYIYDGATIRNQIDTLRLLFKKYYPGKASIAYASKAYFSVGMGRKLLDLKVGLDVVSQAELKLAQKLGFSPGNIHLHGNNKSLSELKSALEWGIQAVVVDNLEELLMLEELAEKYQTPVKIWLRITTGETVETHAHISTSLADSKFGLHIENGEAAEALVLAQTSSWLQLTGLHTHLGSQISDPNPYISAIKAICDLAASMDFVPQEISPGGGWGIQYIPSAEGDDAEPWVRTVSGAIQEACVQHDWPYPHLVLETGRWIVGRAGVAVYEIGTQKHTASGIHIVAVDGGISDNPRVALYQARYSARVVEQPLGEATEKMRIVGKFCETADILIDEINLPPVKRGQHLVVPVSGAYQLSMASNYNFAPRPAVLWLEEDDCSIMQERENPEEAGWWVTEP